MDSRNGVRQLKLRRPTTLNALSAALMQAGDAIEINASPKYRWPKCPVTCLLIHENIEAEAIISRPAAGTPAARCALK